MTSAETVRKPLRLGLILDGHRVGAWVARTLQALAEAEACSLDVVFLPDGGAAAPHPGTKGIRRFGPSGRYLFDRLTHRHRSAFHGQHPFSPVEIDDLIATLPSRITPASGRGDDSGGLGSAVREAAAEACLDLIIDLREGSDGPPTLGAQDVPVWTVRHADVASHLGAAPGFWEWISGSKTTGITLIEQVPGSWSWTPLARSWSATDVRSPAWNQANAFWKSSAMIEREVARVRRMGFPAYRRGRPRQGEPVSALGPVKPPPGNLRLLFLFARRYAWKLLARLRRGFGGPKGLPRWFVLVSPRKDSGNEAEGDPVREGRMEGFRPLVPPPNHHWADPFPIHRNGEDWVFLEEMVQGGNRGEIKALKVSQDGQVEASVPVLSRPYHLSYPFLMERDGDLFMIPESAENRTLDAYRCVDFPGEWEHHGRLMQGIELYDGTLHEHNGRWWLFGVVVSSEGISTQDELFLFHASDPLSSEWTPHPENPIVSDVAKARPGGKIIAHEGSLYRLGQDSRVRYGSALRVFRIDELSESQYAESEVPGMNPVWASRTNGFHHFCLSESLVVADARGPLTLPEELQKEGP